VKDIKRVNSIFKDNECVSVFFVTGSPRFSCILLLVKQIYIIHFLRRCKLPFQKLGVHMVSVKHKSMMELWGQSSQQGPGAEGFVSQKWKWGTNLSVFSCKLLKYSFQKKLLYFCLKLCCFIGC